MPAKDRNLPVNCKKCGKSIAKYNISRHRKTCMMGTLLHCKKRNCNFAIKNAAELSFHIAKAHGTKIRNILNKCVFCQKQFPKFLLIATSSEKSTSSQHKNAFLKHKPCS